MTMRKMLVLLLMLVLFTMGFSAAAQDATPEAAPVETGVSLAIYNQGTALVQDRRLLTFDAGENRVNFTDVAASIDPTSVTFLSLTDRLNTYVLEQNYAFDLVDSAALLNRYIDQPITVVVEDGTVYDGILLSARGGAILQSPDGQVITISSGYIREVRFAELPGGLITRPTLRWLVQSGTAGDQLIQLTYLTGGLSWTADYNVLLAVDNATLDLNGWVTLTNTSGATYQDAEVKLIAGDVNRVQPEMMAMGRMADGMEAMAAAPVDQVVQRDISEYKLYEIARPVTVADNETKQVEFVTATAVPANTFYVYDASFPYYGGGPIYDQYYGATGITDVGTYLEFTTDADGGVGADLPAGRMRVYQQDIDGAPVLIGENSIDHTPEGEDVRIYLGNAFDLVGERTQTSFNFISGDVLEETYEIRLRNRKDDETVEIRVPESLFRWSNWEILNASADYTQINSNTIEFRALVEPGAETVITYTVRYVFPR
ncbi:MAG: DUF4139 domain-containing protein [bacterium]|nr:DUF4139 domain-containing protein [bacterium]